MCLTGGGCASEGCRSKYVIVRALLQFVNRPNGLLWIVFKKETHKHAVDDYVSRLDKAEYVYLLHGVAPNATHVPSKRKQRDAYLYLLLRAGG